MKAIYIHIFLQSYLFIAISTNGSERTQKNILIINRNRRKRVPFHIGPHIGGGT